MLPWVPETSNCKPLCSHLRSFSDVGIPVSHTFKKQLSVFTSGRWDGRRFTYKDIGKIVSLALGRLISKYVGFL